MSALWHGEEAASATGGRLSGGKGTGGWAAGGVSIDTRSLAPGDLFVALTDRRDGHDFVAEAFRRGAAAALVSRRPEGVPPEAPLLIVPDTLEGLVALGRAGRARSRARIAAITGSVGKTSTKEMLRAALAGQGRVHAAEASFNNHWGVPLTLARLPRDADFAIVEIGMNAPGEIAPLSRLARPHVALITTIAPAHLAAFESLAAIAREKAEIFAGLAPGGHAILPADLPESPILAEAARAAGARIVRFGESEGADLRLLEIRPGPEGLVLRAARGAGAPLPIRLATAGRHFACNALGALAAAEALGADPALSMLGLGRWRPPAGRGRRERVVLDPLEDHLALSLIDDAYNANPASLAAALEMLAAAEPGPGGRRIAILGDMLELGDEAAALHAALAAHPAMERVDRVHCAGPLMRALHGALPGHRRGQWQARAEDLAARAHGLVRAGDVILVKGSKGSRIALVVDAIRKLGHLPGADTERGF